MNAGDFSQFLQRILEERCQRNPRYSLRAFARDIGLSAPSLSRLLSGSKGISGETASKVVERLGLSAEEARHLLDHVEAKYARSKTARKLAAQRLSKRTYRTLDVENFKVISEWYHLAILSLLEIPSADWSEKSISKRLGISIHETRSALFRLKRLEMVEPTEKGFRPTGVFFANPAGIPSQAVRSFHRQIIAKASSALDTQNVDERDFSALVLAVDASRINEAKAAIKNFRDDFESRFCAQSEAKTEVYALGMQFFRVTEKNKSKTQ